MIVRFKPKQEELDRLCVGPLGPHLKSFAALLSQHGYCQTIGWRKTRLVANLSRWLLGKHLELQHLDERQIKAFIQARGKQVSKQIGDHRTLNQLLEHLRRSLAIPAAAPSAKSDIDLMQQDYERFLHAERALAPISVQQYAAIMRRFLLHCFPSEKVRLKNLSTKDVTDFILHDTAKRGRRSSQLMATVLRSFLSFLFQHGRIGANLAGAVPRVAAWRLSELPRFLEAKQVEKVLRSCDKRRKIGKRDYAVLLLLARLGLRAGEVANLTLEDIDWRASELLVRGKGARIDKLPLVQDVGQALVEYLRKGRPDCSTRRVFVQSKAPYVGFSNPPNTVSGIVRRAMARAKVDSPHKGAHALRHSLATHMLNKGASLAQIGQVLRHQQVQTTEIYAKVNVGALGALALSWPGGLK